MSSKNISNTLKVKVNEIKKLKKNVIEELKVSKTLQKDFNKKITNLEIEVIRGENNIKEQNDNILSIEKSFKDTIDKLNVKDLEKENFVLSTKIKHLEEVYENLKEESKINETLIEETLPSTKTSDPLTPLDQNYVTLDQLQQHYRLFLNRIQTQLSTLGGGGETRLQYLDDIVGIATDLSEYNGKFLKVDTSQPAGKNFVFETVSGGGGGGSTGAGGTWATFDSNTGITTTKKVKIANDLEVTGVTTFASTVNLGDNDRLNFKDTNTAIYGDVSNLNIEAAANRNVSIKVNAAGGTSGDIILKTGSTESVKVNGDGGVIVTGVTTIGNVVIGGGTTDLVVNGDARVTGILTIGTGSVTIDGSSNQVNVGSATTIHSTGYRIGDSFLHSTGLQLTNVNSSGIITATTLAGTLQTAAQPNVTSLGTLSSLNVTGNVSVGGTLTYEDVTNIDSVGLITARNGIKFGVAGAGGTIRANGDTTLAGVVTASSFVGGGSGLTGFTASQIPNLASSKITSGTFDAARIPTLNQNTSGTSGGLTGSPNINVSRVVGTALSISGISSVGTAITMYGSSGIVSATKFCGDGSQLTGISAGFSADADLNLFASNTCSGCNLDGSAGCFNVFLGACAGKSTTSGHNNISIGLCAGASINTGCCNVFIGRYAGKNVGGNLNLRNVFIGQEIGESCSAVDGDNIRDNVFIGSYTGKQMTEGYNNIIMGRGPGKCLTGGSNNIMLGCGAGGKVTGGWCNIYLGHQTGGGCASTAFRNVAIGYAAGYKLTSGQCNIFLGMCAGSDTTSGQSNISIGCNVQLPSATGNCQLAIGNATDRWIAGDSSYNVTVAGIATVYSATGIVSATKFCGDGSALTGLSGFAPDDQENLVAGTGAGASKDADTCFNILLGKDAAKDLNEGDHNFIAGCRAGCKLTSGQCNVAIGKQSGMGLLSGGNNVFLGTATGNGNSGSITAYGTVAIGFQAGACVTTGNFNIAIGQNAGCKLLDAQDNVFIGQYAGSTVQGSSNRNVRLT